MPVDEEDIRARRMGEPISMTTRSALVAANRSRIRDSDYWGAWIGAGMLIAALFMATCGFVFVMFGGLGTIIEGFGISMTYGIDLWIFWIALPAAIWLTVSLVIIDAVYRRFIKKYDLRPCEDSPL